MNRNEIFKRHGDQMWGDFPYSVHLDNVARFALILNNGMFDENVLQNAALSHDILEDTDTDPRELDDSIRNSVIAVSRNYSQKNFSYQEYIVHLANSGDNLAILVKLSDAFANFLLSEHTKSTMINRYRKSIPVLYNAFFGEDWDENGAWREKLFLNFHE